MANKQSSGHQGEVKNPEHDGRLKGHHGGEAEQAHAKGQDGGGQKGKAEAKGGTQAKGGAQAKGAQAEEKAKSKGQSGQESGGGDDLKAREYKDAEGNIHHHTKKYAEQHRGE